jgi:hypothetical protein
MSPLGFRIIVCSEQLSAYHAFDKPDLRTPSVIQTPRGTAGRHGGDFSKSVWPNVSLQGDKRAIGRVRDGRTSTSGNARGRRTYGLAFVRRAVPPPRQRPIPGSPSRRSCARPWWRGRLLPPPTGRHSALPRSRNHSAPPCAVITSSCSPSDALDRSFGDTSRRSSRRRVRLR